MSFLVPLYLAGMAAVSLPVLFHLIRRSPRGRQAFSAVMFLVPTPPRITRRSRLENWPLLLLRALALCLLALAFGRPFFREAIGTHPAEAPIHRKVILVDTSASMRRDDLWRQALNQIAAVLEAASPNDQVCLATFDRQPRTILSFAEWASLPPSARKDAALDRLAEIAPAREATDLGRALVTAAELVESSPKETAPLGEARTQGSREIILVSDLQLGSRLAALHSHEWPDGVKLVLKTVATNTPTNAGLHALADVFDFDGRSNGANDSQSADGEPEPLLRIAVTNAADSTRETFRIRRLDGELPSPLPLSQGERGSGSDSLEVYVPAGSSRVVRVPAAWIGSSFEESSLEPSAGPLRLVLEGDDHEFDNSLEIAPALPNVHTVLYVGDDAADDPAGPRYYVERAFPKTPRRTVTVAAHETAAPLPAEFDGGVALVIAADALSEPHVTAMREYLLEGGTLLYLAKSAADCRWLEPLLECDGLGGAEADLDGYAMLTDVDFDHPILAPFADVRFADFTKIHVWRHRRFHLDPAADCRVLARFDNGDPAIVEKFVGAGRVLLFAAGWHPADSQLALSSKFVPLLNAILDDSAAHRSAGAGVGSNADGPAALGGGVRSNADGPADSDRSSHRSADFRASSESSSQFRMSLPADESKTSPLPLETLEAFGVRLAGASPEPSSTRLAEGRQQLLSQEIEQRQKLWRWLIVGAISVLILETWLARRLSDCSPLAPRVDATRGAS